MQVQETTISLGTLGGYPSPRLKPGESRPQTPVFVEALKPVRKAELGQKISNVDAARTGDTNH